MYKPQIVLQVPFSFLGGTNTHTHTHTKLGSALRLTPCPALSDGRCRWAWSSQTWSQWCAGGGRGWSPRTTAWLWPAGAWWCSPWTAGCSHDGFSWWWRERWDREWVSEWVSKKERKREGEKSAEWRLAKISGCFSNSVLGLCSS